jgi:ornithine cyclodeaminase/alanine dehydrogenase-like protein (mu-crystallin family)
MSAPDRPVAHPRQLPQAVVLTEPEIRSLLTPELALAAVRTAFIAHARGQTIIPDVLHMDLPARRGEIHAKGAYLEHASTWCLKAASAFYDNPQRGLPSATGVSLALSAETGFLRAVLLDNGYLTDLRTGAAGALAADLLAPRAVRRVLIVGSGVQARYQLEALLGVRQPESVTVYSRTREHAARYAREMTATHKLPVDVADSLADAVGSADVIVMTTPSRTPLLRAAWLKPGTHITAMGSDLPGKQELEVAVLRLADLLAADHIGQAEAQGELQHAPDDTIDRSKLVTLGELAAGDRPGRTRPSDVTVADLTGVGIQDTALADLAVTRAEQSGIGQPLSAR